MGCEDSSEEDKNMKDLGAWSMQIQCIMGLSSLALLHGPSYSFISQIQLITIPPGVYFGTAEFVQSINARF